MHTIQLRGPWQVTPITRTRWSAQGESLPIEGDLPAPGRLNPVGEWSPLLGSFRGRAKFERTFHQPTGLSGEDVMLVVEGVDALGVVFLNDRELGSVSMTSSLRLRINDWLQGRNRLVIEIDLPATDDDSAPLARGDRADDAPGGLIGGVRLEIGYADSDIAGR